MKSQHYTWSLVYEKLRENAVTWGENQSAQNPGLEVTNIKRPRQGDAAREGGDTQSGVSREPRQKAQERSSSQQCLILPGGQVKRTVKCSLDRKNHWEEEWVEVYFYTNELKKLELPLQCTGKNGSSFNISYLPFFLPPIKGMCSCLVSCQLRLEATHKEAD